VAATAAALAAADVVVFVLPGLALAEAVAALEARLAAPPWDGLAGAPVRAFALDGRRFVNSPGPTLVRAAELLASALHGAASGVAPAPDELRPLAIPRRPPAAAP
jgi:iron complex transport system substrate-binding protein